MVLARYSIEDASGEARVDTRCAIYYQRTGGFEADQEFEAHYRCTEEDTMEEVIRNKHRPTYVHMIKTARIYLMRF